MYRLEFGELTARMESCLTGVGMIFERSDVLQHQPSGLSHSAAVGAIAIALAVIVFCIDTFTKIEGAIAVLYVIVLLLASETLTRIGLLLTVGGCLVLTVTSYLLTLGPDPDFHTSLRLIVSLGALGATMALLLRKEAFRVHLMAQNAAVRASEARYRSIFDKTRVALWERDYSQVRSLLMQLKASGVVNFKDYARANPKIIDECIGLIQTVAANDAARELLDSTADEAGLGSMKQFIVSGCETFLDILEAIFLGQTHFEGKGKVTTATGEIRQVLLSISFPEDPASFSRVMVGMVDITQRELTQMALAQAQAELTRASKAATVGALSASLAHELNQPLGAIVVNARTLLRWLDREPPDLGAVRRSIDRMIRDSQRASEIIKNTRNMLSQSDAKTEPVDLRTLIDETQALLEHDLQRHAIIVKISSAVDLPFVRAVRIEIQQVIINLMTNAIQSISDAGAEDRQILVDIAPPSEGKVTILIRDSGPGISEEAAQNLFAPFYTTKTEGMGVGLSICRSTLESRGGTLEGYNHPHGGAAFEMKLPIEVTDG